MHTQVGHFLSRVQVLTYVGCWKRWPVAIYAILNLSFDSFGLFHSTLFMSPAACVTLINLKITGKPNPVCVCLWPILYYLWNQTVHHNSSHHSSEASRPNPNAPSSCMQCSSHTHAILDFTSTALTNNLFTFSMHHGSVHFSRNAGVARSYF